MAGDLRPCTNLLDPLFGGYKLSLQAVPVHRQDLGCGTDRVLPNENQYSLMHLKLFSLHNHLYADPWWDVGIYYIDKEWNIHRIISDPDTGRLQGTKKVWQIPCKPTPHSSHYNTSLSFPSEGMAVASDGAGLLYILKTGHRQDDSPWELEYSDDQFDTGEKDFIICDSRFEELEEQGTPNMLQHGTLCCVLLHIGETIKQDTIERRSTGCFNITLVSYTMDWHEGAGIHWELTPFIRELSAPGDMYYMALERGCCALYLASEYPFKFVVDSKNHNVKEVQNNGEDKQEMEYMWLQTTEDITLTFRLPENAEKSDVNVLVKDLNLCISYREKVLLEGPMTNLLDASLTTWAIEMGKLEVNLVKAEAGLMWSELVIGNTKGEQVLDPALVEVVHQRLAHLCSNEEVKEYGCIPGFNSAQLEDCDAPPNTMGVLARYDLHTCKITHQINLGGLRWLFNTPKFRGQVPSICLRHDVDGCVWQPETPMEGHDVWPCTHLGTFLAFGYVQASKEERKFSLCPTDRSYVAICEAFNRVYIYRKPQALESEVRNRHTGQRVSHTAQHQVVNLGTEQEILGVHATADVLYILTTDKVMALQING